MRHYKYFNKNGECNLPFIQEIIGARLRGSQHFLILDSNVCFDIIQVVNKKVLNEPNLTALTSFFGYLEKHPIDVGGAFGIYELALGKLIYDEDSINKYYDFQNKLMFGLDLNIDQIRNRNFNYYPKQNLDKHIESSFISESIKRSYVSLLKMRAIGIRNGINKKNASKNVIEFLEWLDSKLNISLGVEIQLALYLFGGKGNFKKMIYFDNLKSENFVRTLRGTAWDINHFRMLLSMEGLREELKNTDIPIFVTRDENFINLVSEIDTKFIIKTTTNPVMPGFTISYNCPFFLGNEIELNSILDNHKISRRFKLNTPPMMSNVIDDEIKKLENINLSSFSYN